MTDGVKPVLVYYRLGAAGRPRVVLRSSFDERVSVYVRVYSHLGSEGCGG